LAGAYHSQERRDTLTTAKQSGGFREATRTKLLAVGSFQLPP